MPVAGSSAASDRAPGGAAGTALGLHKGIATERAWERPTKCDRWPENLRLESTLGDLVPGRCRATNLCAYCAMLAGVENTEVLWQDALNNSAPTFWTVLGTRTATLDMATFRNARTLVIRAAKSVVPEAEAATLVEYTTGYGKNAGGERRPHWNWTWKHVPTERQEQLHAAVVGAWVGNRDVDATWKAHKFDRSARAIHEMGGLARYLADHLVKESQRPPEGFRGHRFRTTRGYLAEPLPEARERARAALRLRREVWKAEQRGLTGDAALEAAERALYELGELSWELVRLVGIPKTWNDDGTPATFAETPFPVTRR